jgi:hypothetical protein
MTLGATMRGVIRGAFYARRFICGVLRGALYAGHIEPSCNIAGHKSQVTPEGTLRIGKYRLI